MAVNERQIKTINSIYDHSRKFNKHTHKKPANIHVCIAYMIII